MAERSGISRTYVNRLERNEDDVEIETLKKIVEAGLNKHLTISINNLLSVMVGQASS